MPATPAFGNAGFALQVVGMVSSAVGARDAAKSQRIVLDAQAQMDKLNARSAAMAMNGAADLDLINQKAGFEGMRFGSSMNMLSTQRNIFDAKSGAAFNVANAQTGAAMTLLQAGTQAALTLENAGAKATINEIQTGSQVQALEIGAHMAEQSAQLLDLQAESTMLHGEWREQDSRMQYAQAKSRATVQMARGNLDMSEGTPLAQKVGIDLMSERAAIMIQQDTLAQAFGQRMQASNNRLDAGIKRAQAQSVSAIAAITRATDSTMAEMQASTGMKLATMSADSTVQQAQIKSALTDMSAEFELRIAQSENDWTEAMIAAGMLNAEAAADYKHTMAKVLEENSSAAAVVKEAMAAGISPNSAFTASILGGAGQVASSWYNLKKVG